VAGTEAIRKTPIGRYWLYLSILALLCSLAALVGGTAIFAMQARETIGNSERQAQLTEQLSDLQTVLLNVVDAETAQRGYLLTGSPQYLRPYELAVLKVPPLLAKLQANFQAHPTYAASLQKITGDVREKFSGLAQTIDLHDRGERDQLAAILNSRVGLIQMGRIRDHVAGLDAMIGQQRDQLAIAIERGTERSRTLLIVTVSLFLVFVAAAVAQTASLLVVRRRASAELAASERRHRAIVEEQLELVSLSRRDGTLVYVNPAYARHFGLVPQQIIGTNLYHYVGVDDVTAVRERLQAVFDTGESETGENRMVDHAGRVRWVAWTNRTQVDAAGQTLLHSVGRDVTERRMAEEALHASQSFLKRTGRVAGVGGWELEPESGALYWSDEVRRIHEVPADYEPTLATAIGFYAPEARAVIEQAVARIANGGEPWDLELPLNTLSGRRRWVRAVAETVRDQDGCLRIVGALQDITERMLLQQQIAEREQFIQKITDSLPVRIAYVDRELRFQFVNSVHCERFGRPRSEIIGRTRSELTGNADSDVAVRHVQGVLAGRYQRFEFEEVVKGQVRQFESQLIPDQDEHGGSKGFFSIGMDITERIANERALRDLTDIIDHSPDFVVQTNWRGVIHYLNPAARDALGLEQDAPIGGRSFAEFNTPQTNARFENEILPAVARRGVWLGETTVRTQRYGELPVSHLVIAHKGKDGRIVRYSAVMRDIESEVHARQQLAFQRASLHAMVEAMPTLLAIVDADMRYRLINSAYEHWAGMPKTDIEGRTMLEVLGQQFHDAIKPHADKALAGEQVSFDRTTTNLGMIRHFFTTYVPLLLEDGAIDGFIVIAQEVTQHKEQERRLVELSQQDVLTGLLNRAGFQSYLEALSNGDRKAQVALLYIDLDHFKPINDQHGHPMGDEILRMVAKRLKRLVRPTDAVARLGGDEFAIVLKNVTERAGAEGVADKVIAAAHAPFHVGQLTLQIGASVGLAMGHANDDTSWQSLIARADAQLYQAKAAGRGRQA